MSKPIRFTDFNIIIGIDPGTHTGFAVWDRKQQAFQSITTMQLHRALAHVILLRKIEIKILLVIEDARKRLSLIHI